MKQTINSSIILLSQWNYEKNVKINPDELTLGSNEKYGGYMKKDMNGKLP